MVSYVVVLGKRIFCDSAAVEAEISHPTAIDIYQWLREVCSTKLILILRGPGKVVQVDESLFCHKFKIMNKIY